MKYLFITILLVNFNANADALDDYLSKMKSVLQKDDRCEFAVVTVPKKRSQSNLWPRGAVCAGTLVFNEGTMKEKRGCAGFFINADNLVMTPLQPHLDYNLISGKKCDSGGFEALMSDLLFTDQTVSPPKKVPVSWAVTTAYRLPDSQFDVQILYAYKENQKYKYWFNKERSAFLGENKKSN